VTSFTLGFRLFFNLLQINGILEQRCSPRKNDVVGCTGILIAKWAEADELFLTAHGI
jgi:hypothetical protein